MSTELTLLPQFEPLFHLVLIFLAGVLMTVLIDLPGPSAKAKTVPPALE